MPPKTARQPRANETAVLRAWITAGAKDDSASATVAIPDIKPRTPVAAAITRWLIAPMASCSPRAGIAKWYCSM